MCFALEQKNLILIRSFRCMLHCVCVCVELESLDFIFAHCFFQAKTVIFFLHSLKANHYRVKIPPPPTISIKSLFCLPF